MKEMRGVGGGGHVCNKNIIDICEKEKLYSKKG